MSEIINAQIQDQLLPFAMNVFQNSSPRCQRLLWVQHRFYSSTVSRCPEYLSLGRNTLYIIYQARLIWVILSEPTAGLTFFIVHKLPLSQI